MCQFKGCCAPQLSRKVKSVIALALRQRDTLAPAMVGQVDLVDIAQSFTHMISCLTLKFAWVDEMPYLLWQVFT